MLNADFEEFVGFYDDLAAVWPRSQAGRDRALAVYFKRLKVYPLESVRTGYRRILDEDRNRFPTPAEWAKQIPKADYQDMPILQGAAREAYDEAESVFFETDPCQCLACVDAGVSQRPQRYLPENRGDGWPVERWHPKRRRVVYPGQWAHGQELRRWYDARDHFFSLKRRVDRAAPTMPYVSEQDIAVEAQKVFGPEAVERRKRA